MINWRVLARVCMRCVQMFDSFCFQNVLPDRDSGGKNDTGRSTNQLFRIYVGVIPITHLKWSLMRFLAQLNLVKLR